MQYTIIFLLLIILFVSRLRGIANLSKRLFNKLKEIKSKRRKEARKKVEEFIKKEEDSIKIWVFDNYGNPNPIKIDGTEGNQTGMLSNKIIKEIILEMDRMSFKIIAKEMDYYSRYISSPSIERENE